MSDLTRISLPLLNDHHHHPTLFGALSNFPSIENVVDKRKALDLITGNGEGFSCVYGWNSSEFILNKSDIEKMPPRVVLNFSLHGMVMNSGAERLFEERFPELVQNYEDPSWRESNVHRMITFFSSLGALNEGTLAGEMGRLEAAGIFEVTDMLLPGEDIFRLVDGSPFGERMRFFADFETFLSLPDEIRSRVEGVKLFIDGANGASSAALEKPYLNGSRGILNYSEEAFHKTLVEVLDVAPSAAVHAIGDRALETVTGAAAKVVKSGVEGSRIRVEHAQFINRDQASILKECGVILSMQPNFSVDSVIYADRLPAVYCENNNPFRMLIDDIGFIPGRDLIFGSDGMPHGIKSALEFSLFPPVLGQRLTVDEFVAGYCSKITDKTLTFGVDWEEGRVTQIR